MNRKSMVSRCPVCQSGMAISELKCESCDTSVRGRFEIPELCRLPEDLYEFLLVFVRNRGVIREVEKELGISYPTVRARLDSVIAALGFDAPELEVDKDDVIRQLEAGEISPEAAERLLRGEKALDETEGRVEDEGESGQTEE
ncbi:MAG: DUF2089 domain-containing protein [candidate division WOR-3 bacterium]|nr:MAG: DUF2089 domain-containing protein [candidate division WOR-3 bacterium]